MKKWENIKYLIFPFVCLVEGMEKWKSGKLGWREKRKDGKCNLYELTIIPLLHNM